jgi:DNA polymerase III alpha subunit
MSGYAELAVTTNFSFLRGASHGAELVQRAAELGLSAIGVADRNTLAGVVRAHVAAKEARLKLLVGARLVPLEGPEILAYPMDRTAYGRLSRLLSDGKMKPDVPKGECHLTLENILAASEGQVLIVMPPAVPPAAFADTLRKIAAAAPGRTWLAARYTYSGRNRERIARLEELAASANVPLVATNDVLYHAYEPYFLTVHDIVAFARSRGILCQGRGSAANSITCYALGVTSVSPEIGTMVFERFVSEARNEPPDIDVDFEHERREEVIQHIYERYGRHRAGLCATVIHYRGKRAVREVGKAMGLSEDVCRRCRRSSGDPGRRPGRRSNAHARDRPRPGQPAPETDQPPDRGDHRLSAHLSQHVGGFVITEGRLDELVPIENATMEDRTVICWDKDDIDALGILKVDVLALGMLTCIRKAFDLLETHTRPTTRSPRCRPRTRRSTTCCARPTASASSRWKAARR